MIEPPTTATKKIAPAAWRLTGANSKRASDYSRIDLAQLESDIAFWRLIQKPFDVVFWQIERHVAQLADEIERRRA